MQFTFISSSWPDASRVFTLEIIEILAYPAGRQRSPQTLLHSFIAKRMIRFSFLFFFFFLFFALLFTLTYLSKRKEETECCSNERRIELILVGICWISSRIVVICQFEQFSQRKVPSPGKNVCLESQLFHSWLSTSSRFHFVCSAFGTQIAEGCYKAQKKIRIFVIWKKKTACFSLYDARCL